ncbi:murein biosynthesis integral membrane protein MurJ [Oxalobacter paraformigenes]|uniref:Probable lipid II flippase MurJ n=1 Tax=Oxalobacter paraformigenes TaxID=556268 RepID=C3X547_9BURK|nr:murein biosynthesis integral membrane protein MurJ [Oxalobacter paraformigenes]EEO28333.1 integral membrane protein MviN [Oxalobacter paraformigenes]
MNLLKTLVTISGMTMLSRITGLVRELLIARAFGASGFTDAFFVAFRIPNLLRRLFAEGAFSQAFVPILAEYVNKKGADPAKELIDKVATALMWTLVLICVAGIFAAPGVVYLVATGLDGNAEVFELSVLMTRIMFPYILFMSLVALAGGILNTWREFRIPAFTPVLLNVSFIIASLFVAPHLEQPVLALAFAVFAGGLLQLAIQIPALVRIGMMPRVFLNIIGVFQNPGVRRVIRQMVPATFAVSVAQISLMINTNIASRLVHGSVSWISYADRLMEFPNALLGVALGTILLPSLSKAHANNDEKEYSSLLDWGLRLTFLLALPASVMLMTLPVPFTATLFHYGKFSSQDVFMTSNALIAYGIGLIGLIVVRILAPGFYAKQDIKTPVKIAVGVLVVTQLMNLIFVPLYAHAGLALSIGIGACFNAAILFFMLRRRGIYRPQSGWRIFFFKVGIALILLAGVSVWVAGYFDWIALQAHPFLRAGALALVMSVCGVVYFGALFAMGFRLKNFRRIAS